ncbi:MAG: hypothetical protein KGN35_07470 [Betaproteobacteria bacterium]|nr:hypothetical protein [Betaproteobacteria bacterium]
MDAAVAFILKFDGGDTEEHQIDLYDVSQALVGFQRSLALTSHLVINGEIITQAPSLKGARVYARPPEDGSWKVTAIILAGAYTVTTAPMNTPIGHLIHSVYDYVISESLGFHVDYEKSLGQLYEEHNAKKSELPRIEQHQLDSLIEKCTTAITEIHRPIFKTQSAQQATIESVIGDQKRIIGRVMDYSTYQYIHEYFTSEIQDIVWGRISSYNSNTFKGRIYVADEGRPLAFELAESCRSNNIIQLIVASLSVNAIKNYDNEWSTVHCKVFKITSRSGYLKRYLIIEVSHLPIEQNKFTAMP